MNSGFSRATKNATGWGAMRYPQLVLGMLGIFTYVGVEVTIASNMAELLRQPEFGRIQAAPIPCKRYFPLRRRQ